MDYERALKITADCQSHVFHAMGLPGQEPQSLEDYSLGEMLEAGRVVHETDDRRRAEGTSTVVHSVCDDRLVAALYLAANHHGDSPRSPTPVCTVDGKVVVVVRPESHPGGGEPVPEEFEPIEERSAVESDRSDILSLDEARSRRSA